MFNFYTPWKSYKTFGFRTFSGGIKVEQWAKMGEARNNLFTTESFLQDFFTAGKISGRSVWIWVFKFDFRVFDLENKTIYSSRDGNMLFLLKIYLIIYSMIIIIL